MSAYEDPLLIEPAAGPAPARRTRVSAFWANVLVAFGLGIVVVGGLFSAATAAPQLSWTLHKIALRAAGYGVAFDAICAMGVTLFVAGIVARAVAVVARQNERLADVQVDLTLALDQLTADLADVRSGVDQLMTVPEEESAAESVAGRNEKDALYRMAASLDQLAGRLSKRISAELGSVKDGFGELTSGLTRIAERVEQLEKSARAPIAPIAAGVPGASAPRPPAREAARQHGAQAPRTVQPEPAGALEPDGAAEEDDAVMIDLDADETPIELLDRLAEEVEGGETRAKISLYDPEPALPTRPEPGKRANPKTYDSSLDRLLPEDRLRDSRDRPR
jgi:hypothetical protein